MSEKVCGTFYSQKELQKLWGCKQQVVSRRMSRFTKNCPFSGWYRAEDVRHYKNAAFRKNYRGTRELLWGNQSDIVCLMAGCNALALAGPCGDWACIEGHNENTKGERS